MPKGLPGADFRSGLRPLVDHAAGLAHRSLDRAGGRDLDLGGKPAHPFETLGQRLSRAPSRVGGKRLARYDRNGNRIWIRQLGSSEEDLAAASRILGKSVKIVRVSSVENALGVLEDLGGSGLENSTIDL